MRLLADSSEGSLDIATPIGAAVLAVAVLALLGVAVLWRSTKPPKVRPGPPTMELRVETPALVDLLTGGFEVDDDAMPATVVDLAARGWYTIDDIGGDRIVLHLRRREPSGDSLTPYEARVLQHIRDHADGGAVPAPVLTLGPQGVSQRWFRGFVREVTAHGRQLGLCRPRWDLAHTSALWILAAIGCGPAVAVIVLADESDDVSGWASLGTLLTAAAVGLGLVLVWIVQRIVRSDAQTSTDAGRAAAAHWLGVRDFYRRNGRFEDKPAPSVVLWERALAYATALGLTPLVERQIPFETECDRHAWSRATGEWRRVKVHYPTRRPGWGRWPLGTALRGLVQLAVSGLVTYGALWVVSNRRQIDDLVVDDRQRTVMWIAALAVAGLALSFGVIALVKLVFGVTDLFAKRTLEGEVVRTRTLRREQGHYLAVDDGTSDRVLALRVHAAIYHRAQQGARARLTVTPRLGYVSAIEVLAPPRRGPSDTNGTPPPAPPDVAATATILDTLMPDGRPDLHGSPGNPADRDHPR